MGNFNDEILQKAKNKINSMLSEKQKEELLNKIKDMDKNSLKSILKNINLDKVEDPDLREFVKNFKNNI